MAAVVTSQTLFNGRRHLVMKFTNVSDATDETNVKKVDATLAANGIFLQGNTILPGVHLKITRVVYDVKVMLLRMLWEATANTDILVLGGFGSQDYRNIGGLQNPAAAGATGSILFTTQGGAVGASYSVTMWLTKGIPTGF